MRLPEIGIAMTCYNQGHFIRDAIKSIVSQTINDWELVIVDDKSTDNSIEIINKLKKEFQIENKVRLIKHKKNMGYGTSLACALEIVNAPLIAIIDSDDALANNKALEISIQKHNNYPHIAMTYSNYIECDKNLNQKTVFKTRQLKEDESYISAGVRVSHLKVLKKYYYKLTEGINLNLRQTVDKDLTLKLEEVGKLFHIDKDLYFYRHHEDNLSRSIHKKDKQYRKFVATMRSTIYEEAKKRRGIK